MSSSADFILVSREQAQQRSWAAGGSRAWRRVLASQRPTLFPGRNAEPPNEIVVTTGQGIDNRAAILRAAILAQRWQCSVGLLQLAEMSAPAEFITDALELLGGSRSTVLRPRELAAGPGPTL